MPNAPDAKFNALARYEWPAFGGSMSAQVDMSYVGDRALEAENHPALNGEAYDLWNAHVQWRTASEALAVKLWVTNLTDEVYYPMAFDHTTNTGMTQHIVAPPRWFGATVTYSW
jgi:iron complex outermembrane receptor protein